MELERGTAGAREGTSRMEDKGMTGMRQGQGRRQPQNREQRKDTARRMDRDGAGLRQGWDRRGRQVWSWSSEVTTTCHQPPAGVLAARRALCGALSPSARSSYRARYPIPETGTARPTPQRRLPEVAGPGAATTEHPTLPDAGGRWRPRGAAARGGGAGPGSRYLGSGRTILLLARAAGVALLFSIAIR